MQKNKHLCFGKNKGEVMEVKKEKFSAFFKGKSFYAVLAVGTVVAFAIGIINTNMVSENDKQLAKNPSTEIVENVQQVEEENKLSENNMDSTDSAKVESKLLKENNKEEENEKKSEDNKKEEAEGRLIYGNRLETALKCAVLFNIFAIFRESGCTDHLDLAA